MSDIADVVNSPWPQEQLLTIRDIATLFRVCKRTVERWADEGRLPEPLKINSKLVRYRARDIKRYLDNPFLLYRGGQS